MARTPWSQGRGSHPPVDEQAAQGGSDKVGHKGAVVPAHGLQALAVHPVMSIRPGGEEQASIPLLADEQVGKVDLEEDPRLRPETSLRN